MSLNQYERRTSFIQQRVTPSVKKKAKKIVAHLKKNGIAKATEADMLEVVITEYEKNLIN